MASARLLVSPPGITITGSAAVPVAASILFIVSVTMIVASFISATVAVALATLVALVFLQLRFLRAIFPKMIMARLVAPVLVFVVSILRRVLAIIVIIVVALFLRVSHLDFHFDSLLYFFEKIQDVSLIAEVTASPLIVFNASRWLQRLDDDVPIKTFVVELLTTFAHERYDFMELE